MNDSEKILFRAWDKLGYDFNFSEYLEIHPTDAQVYTLKYFHSKGLDYKDDVLDEEVKKILNDFHFCDGEYVTVKFISSKLLDESWGWFYQYRMECDFHREISRYDIYEEIKTLETCIDSDVWDKLLMKYGIDGVKGRVINR
jgi:hypothetical protein